MANKRGSGVGPERVPGLEFSFDWVGELRPKLLAIFVLEKVKYEQHNSSLKQVYL